MWPTKEWQRMPRIEPDRREQHNSHVDEFYPGLIRSEWKYGPLRVVRERKYTDRSNALLKSEAWIFSLAIPHYRAGIKLERDA